jgi:hypothetical protein
MRPTFQQACAKYVHRYTMEHVPAWARKPLDRSQLVVNKPADEGDYYAPQFRSDLEWYENTLFPGEPGHIGRRTHCYTTGQTWPLGQWLHQPYAR